MLVMAVLSTNLIFIEGGIDPSASAYVGSALPSDAVKSEIYLYLIL
jgi:hypothetical protein